MVQFLTIQLLNISIATDYKKKSVSYNNIDTFSRSIIFVLYLSKLLLFLKFVRNTLSGET